MTVGQLYNSIGVMSDRNGFHELKTSIICFLMVPSRGMSSKQPDSTVRGRGKSLLLFWHLQ
jgi:hypothetical protein